MRATHANPCPICGNKDYQAFWCHYCKKKINKKNDTQYQFEFKPIINDFKAAKALVRDHESRENRTID